MVVTPFSRGINLLTGITLGLLFGGVAYSAETPNYDANQTPGYAQGCSAAQASNYRESINYALQAEGSGHLADALQRLETQANSLGSCRLGAKLYVQIGLLEFRVGRYADAEVAVERARGIHNKAPALTSLELGVSYFVTASTAAIAGQHLAAIRAFQQTTGFFARCGPQAHQLLTRVYSDMAMLYVQQHDLKAAEEMLNKGIASEQQDTHPDAVQEILIKDTLCHLEYHQGRMSDAMNVTRALLGKYGTDTTISPLLRAHLYEDYATFCMREDRLNDAVQYFKISVDLENEVPVPVSQARTLALLGRAQMLDSQLSDAEQTLTKAVNQAKAADENPIDHALVSETYGEFLIVKRHWNDARTALKEAVTDGNSSAAFASVHIAALIHLADVDHHLHLKKEEKQSRRQAKLLQAGLQYPGAKDVVDIATLRNSYTGDRH